MHHTAAKLTLCFVGSRSRRLTFPSALLLRPLPYPTWCLIEQLGGPKCDYSLRYLSKERAFCNYVIMLTMQSLRFCVWFQEFNQESMKYLWKSAPPLNMCRGLGGLLLFHDAHSNYLQSIYVVLDIWSLCWMHIGSVQILSFSMENLSTRKILASTRS